MRRLLTALPVLACAVSAGAVLPIAPAGAAPAAPAVAGATATTADFYKAPSPLPAAAPGTLIRSRPATISLGATAPAAKAWTVMYHSRDVHGKDIAVTGTIFTPTAAWTGTGKRPVVGFAVGTQGPGPQCAPSKQFVAGSEYENSNVAMALQKGWAVAVTDYEGYTTGSRATYVVGRSEGQTVLDSLRAAQRLTVSGVAKDAPVLLWGYSQGGGGSAWATVLQPSYAPELRLKGTAAGGVPADAKVVGDSLNKNLAAAFLLYSVSGFQAAYPSAFPVSSYLNAAGKAALADINTQCTTDSLTKYAFTDVNTYFKPGTTVASFEAIPSVAKVLADNTLTTKSLVPHVAVFQYHGLGDEIVPIAQALALHTAWCGKGVTTTFTGLPGDHLSTSAEGAPLAVNFLTDRLAGKAVVASCTP